MHVAIPVLDEPDWLPKCLASLEAQRNAAFDVWVCVNQPDTWWEAPEHRAVCERNAETLAWLRTARELDLRILDRTSRGNGWPRGKGGVGRARKVLMDTISEEAADDDLIVSLDADTLVEPDYLSVLAATFRARPDMLGLAVPYFHKLTGDLTIDRAILRYEIYLRHYAVNLWRIRSPYAFTAMGSGLVFPVRAYRRVGGMPPRVSGEDFYFLQKLVKNGRVLHWCEATVYPSARVSARVAFGTGPALQKGTTGDWEAYPIFAAELFDEIAETVARFRDLHARTVDTPLSAFLGRQLKTDDPWATLRRNHSDPARFVRACHERLDGLRIFQYLRAARRNRPPVPDETALFASLRRHYLKRARREAAQNEHARTVLALLESEQSSAWRFGSAPPAQLDAVRCFLAGIENHDRRAHARACRL